MKNKINGKFGIYVMFGSGCFSGAEDGVGADRRQFSISRTLLECC